MSSIRDMIEIKSQAYTIEAFTAEWAESDETLSPAAARACADEQYAFLINETGEVLRGWSYTGESFTGRADYDALRKIDELIGRSIDEVVANLDEIKAEVAAEQTAERLPSV